MEPALHHLLVLVTFKADHSKREQLWPRTAITGKDGIGFECHMYVLHK